MQQMKEISNSLKKNKYYLYTITVIILIIIHGRFDSFFKIDSLTLILLLLLFFLPYIPLIKTWKFKYGDFETEVTTEEINDIERKAKEVPQEAEKAEGDNILNLKILAESDPQLALAKMRIEIEKQLRLLFNIYIPENEHHAKSLSLGLIIESLERRNIIEESLADVIKGIIKVANRTIHGEEISSENTIKLIAIYNTALSELEYVIIDHALKSVKKEAIDSITVDTYFGAEYMLTTITPIVNDPHKNIYKVNQAELDAFLEGYNEYGEFIVDLRKIEKIGK
jgi:hypothetical protein